MFCETASQPRRRHAAVRLSCNVVRASNHPPSLRCWQDQGSHHSHHRRLRSKRLSQTRLRAPAHALLVLTMLFPEEDAAQLKTWIVKRIENTLVPRPMPCLLCCSLLVLNCSYSPLVSTRSDADSDVLADYVIALLRHDGDQAAIRKLCEEEIPDFLTEGSFWVH